MAWLSAIKESHFYHGGTEGAEREISKQESSRPCLNAGVDVGRTQDLTVNRVIEKTTDFFTVRAIRRLRDLRLPEQQSLLITASDGPSQGRARRKGIRTISGVLARFDK